MTSTTPTPLTLRSARAEDLEAIMAIEEACFALPWPATLIAEDLSAGGRSCYWVLLLDDKVVAYLGGWLVDLDFHIGSLATAPPYRRQGFARLLLLCALRHAASRGAETAFLEYRVSNRPAARLYASLGFRRLRVRRGYYTDNGEDAVEVALTGLHEDATRARLAEDVDLWLRDHNYDVRLTDFECR